MAVGALGNLLFINQNSAFNSAQVSNENARLELSQSLNLADFNKEKPAQKLEKITQSNEVENSIKDKEKQRQKKEFSSKKRREKNEPAENQSLLDLRI